MLDRQKPFSPSCERNSQPLFDKIDPLLANGARVLEIGSGTGQHAVFFKEKRPDLVWQCSDLIENHPGISLWLDECIHEFSSPIEFDMNREKTWPSEKFDALFTANTFHIAAEEYVLNFCKKADRLLSSGGSLMIYGPFRYGGDYTSESNSKFDQWLKERDSNSGIRDIERISAALAEAGFQLVTDTKMPANNQLLVYQVKQ